MSAPERGRDLRPARERSPPGQRRARVEQRDACPVDDHDAAARVLLVACGDVTSRAAASAARARACPPRRWPSGARRARSVASGRAARCARTGCRAGSRATTSTTTASAMYVSEKAAAHVGDVRRSPTPRTVSIHPGSPSFFRSAATWTSIVFVAPEPGRLPDVLEDPPPRDDGAGVAREQREQVELLGRQVDLVAVERRRGGCACRPRAARRAGGRASRAFGGAPADGADAGNELAEARRA